MVNQKKNSVKQQYYIPLEVKKGTIITNEYESAPHQWSKIGNRLVRTILVPATKELYEAYMRPEWREDKKKQRLIKKRRKREQAQVEHRLDKSVQGWDTPVSYEQLAEMEYGFEADFDLEVIIERRELIQAFYRELAKLKELDQKILYLVMAGYSEADIAEQVERSQKCVNKRKHKAFAQLKNALKNYR